MCSADDKPRHEYCPLGPNSWCKWRKAEASGEDLKLSKHPAPLNSQVQEHVEPIFQELSRDDLLGRCLGGHTQKANEFQLDRSASRSKTPTFGAKNH